MLIAPRRGVTAPVTRLGGGWPHYHCTMTKVLTLHSASSDVTATGSGWDSKVRPTGSGYPGRG